MAALERGMVPGAAAEGEPGTGKPVFRMERSIRDYRELEESPVGVYQTPQGTLEKRPDGKLRVKDLSPEAKLRIQQIEAEEVRKFGKFPGMEDVNAPKPPIQVGKPWFNPFTGAWGKGGLEGEVSYMDDGIGDI